MDFEVADRRKGVWLSIRLTRGIIAPLRAHRDERAVREIDRKVVAAREARDAAGVVVVLVRDQDRGEIARARGRGARDAVTVSDDVETAIDQNAGGAGLDDEAVAFAAAAQRCEAHQSRISLQLIVEQREDAVRRRRLLARAFLVEHVHFGALAHVLHEHAILLVLLRDRCCPRT